MKAIIIYNQLSENPQADELDVLDQVEFVGKALEKLGYEVVKLEFGFDIPKAISEIKKHNANFIFNLVESIDNKGELIYFAPAILKYLKIPYCGVPLEGMFLTSNKVLTKQFLRQNGISTPDLISYNEIEKIEKSKTYLFKPLWEDGSLGLDEENIFKGSDVDILEKIKTFPEKSFFIEEYIDGMEFNVSVLGSKNGAEVLPLAEICFIDFPENKPKIVGYTAKWNENSFEYKHTIRSFEFGKTNTPLIAEIKKLCIDCWNLFGLKGYARVDIRVDKNNKPYVLEINANPCISPDSGFVAATQEAGFDFTNVIKRIIEDI